MVRSNTSGAVERATFRTVVLLRRSEKAKLERMASKHKVSTAEVIRKFIRFGDSVFKDQREDEIIEAALRMISVAVKEANESLTRTIDKLDALHLELSHRNLP